MAFRLVYSLLSVVLALTVSTPAHNYTVSTPTLSVPTHNYIEALQKSLYFFDGQFSGPKPSWSTANWRGPCHLNDGKDVGRDLTGGFFDCGDGIMFGLPSFYASSVLGWTMLEYNSTLKTANVDKHALDVLKHQTDFIIKAHPSPNVLYGQKGYGISDHAVWVPYEYGTTDRPSWQVNSSCPGSDLAGQASATMSIGSIIFKSINATYSNLLLAHARQLFIFSTTYKGKYSDCIKDASNYYSSSGYEDEQLWASLWLYKATSEQAYKDYAIANSRVLVKQFMSWSLAWDTAAVGNMHLLCKLLNDTDACFQVENYLEYWSASGLSTGGKIPYTKGGLAFLSAWGSLRYPNIMAFMAVLYVDQTPTLDSTKRQRYIAFAKSQIDYPLGTNPLNMSYLVGYGTKWPQRTHHRNAHGSSTNSMSDPDKNRHVNWMIAGGPDINDQFPDERSNYVMAESGMDYQVSFIAGVASVSKLFGGAPISPFPLPEKKGIEYYINASVQQQNARTVQLSIFFVAETGWPPRSRDLLFKVFFHTNIPGLQVKSYYNQNSSISQVGRCNDNLDYLNVSFGAGFIYPGSVVSSIKQVQLTFATSALTLNLSQDWSFQDVGAQLAVAHFIPIYEDLKLQNGKEPNCTYPSVITSAPTPTPSGSCLNDEWSQCNGLEFAGDKCCQTGLRCVYINDYYSQCQK